MNTQSYYTLLGIEHGQWAIVFGDYSLEVVKDEQLDLIESDEYPAEELLVIQTADDQESIEKAVEKMNEGEIRRVEL